MIRKFFALFLLIFVVSCETTKIEQRQQPVVQKDPYDNIDTADLLNDQKGEEI